MTREYVTIPKEAWDFLNGAGELDGVSFGERHPTRSGAFWWRSYIAALTAPEPPPSADDAATVERVARAIFEALHSTVDGGPDWTALDLDDRDRERAMLSADAAIRAMKEGGK